MDLSSGRNGPERVAAAFARYANRRWCTVCTELLRVDGAGITLFAGAFAGPVCVSHAAVAEMEDLQFVTGVGPCRDALASRTPVHVERIERSTSWPMFAAAAARSGYRSVSAYPLIVHDLLVGVLTLYRHGEGGLSIAQDDDSLAMADALALAILDMQRDSVDGELAEPLAVITSPQVELYQATGIVSGQLQVATDEALIRIRGHAFATGRPIADIAADVVHSQLHLPDDRIG